MSRGDFADDLAWQAQHLPRLDAFYASHWPDFVSVQRYDGTTPTDRQMQRWEVDATVHLEHGWDVHVEEKVTRADRRYHAGIVVLERWSAVPHEDYSGRPGWAWRTDLGCDLIAYAWIGLNRVGLVSYRLLRDAVTRWGDDWLDAAAAKRDGFYTATRPNRGREHDYATGMVMVPLSVLAATCDMRVYRLR